MSNLVRAAFVVTGRVQGVGFRVAAARAATAGGLVGYVQNRADGAVTGAAQGAADALAGFRNWLARGPTLARVDQLEWREVPPVAGEQEFAVRR
jgi:acylphosphatase